MKNNIEKILVGAVYIAPRSQFKAEAVENIIETMYYAQSLCEKPLRYIIAGDVNKTDISDILDSNGQLKQICSVATRKTATLENVITDLATFYSFEFFLFLEASLFFEISLSILKFS